MVLNSKNNEQPVSFGIGKGPLSVEREELEKRLRDLAMDMVNYSQYEYPVEWKKSADKWNALLDKFDCHELATKIKHEYGLS